MSRINSADNHSSFIPINIEDSSNNLNEKKISQSNTNTTKNDPDFQIVMKSLLESRINSWCNSLNSSDSSSIREPLFPITNLLPLMGIQDNTKALIALINQLQQPDLSSEYSNRPGHYISNPI